MKLIEMNNLIVCKKILDEFEKTYVETIIYNDKCEIAGTAIEFPYGRVEFDNNGKVKNIVNY